MISREKPNKNSLFFFPIITILPQPIYQIVCFITRSTSQFTISTKHGVVEWEEEQEEEEEELYQLSPSPFELKSPFFVLSFTPIMLGYPIANPLSLSSPMLSLTSACSLIPYGALCVHHPPPIILLPLLTYILSLSITYVETRRGFSVHLPWALWRGVSTPISPSFLGVELLSLTSLFLWSDDGVLGFEGFVLRMMVRIAKEPCMLLTGSYLVVLHMEHNYTLYACHTCCSNVHVISLVLGNWM